jgi:hypothetical protein
LVTAKYTSPFATTQNADDLISLQKTVQTLLGLGPQAGEAAISMGLKVKDIPAYVARLNGVPERLIASDADREELVQQAMSANQAMQDNQAQHVGNIAAAESAGKGGGGESPGGPAPVPAQ